MGRNTSLKLIIVIVGILVFVQIVFYNSIQRDNIKSLRMVTETVATESRSLQIEHDDMQRQLGAMEDELREIAATVPPAFLTGFEDHEAKLSQFIDYLQSPIFQEIGGEFSVKEAQEYKKSPVPLHSSDLSFKFSFNYIYEAEDFFDYVLGQDYFPIQISSLDMSRKKADKTEGTLEASLLVLTKLPMFSSLEGEGK